MTSGNGANKTYTLYNPTRIAPKRGLWKQTIKFALDTHRLSAHGRWWWWWSTSFNIYL